MIARGRDLQHIVEMIKKIQITKYIYRMILFVVGKNVDIYTYTCVKYLAIGRYPRNIYQINE